MCHPFGADGDEVDGFDEVGGGYIVTLDKRA